MLNNDRSAFDIAGASIGWRPVEQGRAGWLGAGDAALRVLIMQLTVSSTSGVRGTVNIAGLRR